MEQRIALKPLKVYRQEVLDLFLDGTLASPTAAAILRTKLNLPSATASAGSTTETNSPATVQ